MKTIYERLDQILPLIMDTRFRENKGLGNEIGFYIFDYDPRDELIVREHIAFLKQKVNKASASAGTESAGTERCHGDGSSVPGAQRRLGDIPLKEVCPHTLFGKTMEPSPWLSDTDNAGFTIKEFDLFQIILDVLSTKGYLDKVMAMEKEKGTAAILTPLKKTLRLTQQNDLIVEHIRHNTRPNNIVFLTGVGKAWPVIRSHSILNALHAVIEDVPLIMFYPGTYSGQDLHLFDEISDQNYYRAFKLIER